MVTIRLKGNMLESADAASVFSRLTLLVDEMSEWEKAEEADLGLVVTMSGEEEEEEVGSMDDPPWTARMCS